MVWLEEDMNQLAKFGLILGMICLIATLVLALTFELTKSKIEAGALQEEQDALKIIIPQADSFEYKTVDGIDYYEAYCNKNLVGYCLKVTGAGYGGYIRMVVGIDIKGKIEGVEVLEHYETPGLGAKINEVRPGEKGPWFLEQFKGRQACALEVKKDIDAITGATISSRAVTDAINKGVKELFEKIKR
jgi:electron transport complex protein RnfG